MRNHQQEPTTAQGRDDLVLRYMPVRLGAGTESYVSGAAPIKEGLYRPVVEVAERSPRAGTVFTSDVEAPGERCVWILAHGAGLETPVFRGSDDREAIAVFTGREPAVLYLQVTGWEDHRVEELTPTQLGQWLERAHRVGIRQVLIDPNRRSQERGEVGATIDLDAVRDFSGENVFHEVMAGKT
jgi:hypothetical protein